VGGKTAQSTQQVQVPPAVLAQYQSVMNRANTTADTPFQKYSGQFISPVNAQQQSGIAGTNTAATEAQPYFGAATGTLEGAQRGTAGINNAATGLAAGSAAPVNPSALDSNSINRYMSPYLQDVGQSEANLLGQNNLQQQSGALGTAIKSGAFGGDRTGIAAANLEQQQNLANANIYSNIFNTGFTNAQGVAQQQQGIGLAAGQANRAALGAAGQELAGIGQTQYGEGANTATTLAGLGAGAQGAALQGAQAQIGAGTLEQQTAQAQDTAQYNQFLQQQSYPFQVDQFLGNLAEGTGALSGSTTTTQQPGGFFSDKRLKHDIEKIGKTFDGQHIYSYKMHGDPRTHIGLMAQEVEKKHPGSVGLAGGYKIVDYGRATEEAANRGHFYSGGVVPIRRAYAMGGDPYSSGDGASYDLGSILASQREMYQPHAQSRSIPNQGSGHQLVVASGSPTPPPSGASNVNQTLGLGEKGYQMYKHFNTPTTTPGTGVSPSAAGAAAEGPATDTAAAGAAQSGVAAPAAGAADAAGTGAATTGASTAVAGAAGAGAVDAGATEAAAALAAEYAAADAAVALAAASRGGRIRPKFDAGGMPYEGGVAAPYQDPGGAMAIPDTENTAKLQTAGPIKKQPTGLQTMITMGNPNDVGSIMGGMFSNTALARGGVAARRGYDEGGAPDDPDMLPELLADSPTRSFSGIAPEEVKYTGGVNAMPVASEKMEKPEAVPIDRSPDPQAPAQDHWYKHAENVIPLLTGIAAMGTAPTRSWGTALAAGLGAGTQAYLPVQQQQADIQRTQLQNQRTRMQLGIMQDQNGGGGQGGSAPLPRSPILAGIGVDPSEIASNTKNRFAVSDIWQPQEQAALSYAQRLQMAGLPNTLPAIQAQHTARITNLQTANQQGASVAYDQAYDVASTPKGAALAKMRTVAPQEAQRISAIAQDPEDADALARTWAAQAGNSVYRYSGRKPVTGKDGVARDQDNGRPLLGQVPEGMSAEQHANYLERLAAPVDTGAPARPSLGTTPAGSALPSNPGTTTAIPGANAPSPPARTPVPQRQAAVAASVKPGFDFKDAAAKPSWLSDPTHVMTAEEKPIAEGYAAKEIALKTEANQLPNTQRELVKAERVLNLLPHAQTGPGTNTMSAIQTALGNMTGSQFTSWLGSNPSAHAILQKQLGKEALDTTLADLRSTGASVRLGAQESGLIINTLSASTEMPKPAIKALMEMRKQDLQYEMKRQMAIPSYIAQGKDASLFDSYYAAPGRNSVTNALSTAAPAGATLRPPARTNAQGWLLHKDANGNMAYVSPDGKQFQEAK
jgi:hypothetical protein